MKKLLLGMSVCALILSSCGGKSEKEYNALLAERDSLQAISQKSATELDDMMNILNEIEDNFEKIKTAENYLSVNSSSSELTPSTKDRLRSDMELITNTLEANKTKIEALEKQLKKSNVKSTELSKAVERMRAELNEKTQLLVLYQEELAKKDTQIAMLSENVSALSSSVNDLSTKTKDQQAVIDAQSQVINTVYYIFGTDKELKDQRVLVKGQLGTDFNKDAFIKVKDVKSLNKVYLYSSKSGKLISKHPAGTYSFNKDEKGDLWLNILDVQKFWSLTKYLVVEVNV